MVGQQQGGISPQEHGKVANSEGVIDQQQWMVREVILLGDDKPWVFARSVIPMALWQSDFTDLNTQPLGQRIFNDSKFSRMPFEITQIQQSHPFCKKMRLCPSQDLWGRRSVFRFEALNMMVCEIFLPDSPAYLPQDKVQYESK